MTTIEVRISKHKLDQLQHEIHIANYTLRALRDAGIPVRGAMFPVGLNGGELTVKSDHDGLLFTWRGEAALVKVEATEEEIW